jgi:hypothetical protein
VLHDPIRDKLRIAQAVRVMRVTVLDYYRDPAAQLLITILDQQRMPPEQRIGAATNIQQPHRSSPVAELVSFQD